MNFKALAARFALVVSCGLMTATPAAAQFWQCVTFARSVSGIEIRGNTAKLKAGPVKFPNAKVEVVLRVDRDSGTVPTPRVLFSQEGLSLFGSKSTLDMTMFLTSSSLEAKQDFGELFKFNFI